MNQDSTTDTNLQAAPLVSDCSESSTSSEELQDDSSIASEDGLEDSSLVATQDTAPESILELQSILRLPNDSNSKKELLQRFYGDYPKEHDFLLQSKSNCKQISRILHGQSGRLTKLQRDDYGEQLRKNKKNVEQGEFIFAQLVYLHDPNSFIAAGCDESAENWTILYWHGDKKALFRGPNVEWVRDVLSEQDFKNCRRSVGKLQSNEIPDTIGNELLLPWHFRDQDNLPDLCPSCVIAAKNYGTHWTIKVMLHGMKRSLFVPSSWAVSFFTPEAFQYYTGSSKAVRPYHILPIMDTASIFGITWLNGDNFRVHFTHEKGFFGQRRECYLDRSEEWIRCHYSQWEFLDLAITSARSENKRWIPPITGCPRTSSTPELAELEKCPSPHLSTTPTIPHVPFRQDPHSRHCLAASIANAIVLAGLPVQVAADFFSQAKRILDDNCVLQPKQQIHLVLNNLGRKFLAKYNLTFCRLKDPSEYSPSASATGLFGPVVA